MARVSARDVKIGPTAHYTAYVWHRLGMPYAEHFATPLGARLFWSLRAAGEWLVALSPTLPSMPQYLELRHRLIEHELTRLRPDRVVELGAGLSRRGLTWAVDHGVRYTEVDLPHMVAAKEQRIAALPGALPERARRRLDHVARDVLAPDFPQWLEQQLAGAEQPVVIAEGLLGYFEPEERARLARSIAAALRRAGGGSFLCDLRAREGGRGVELASRFLKLGIRAVTRGRGARADFASVAEVRDFFERAEFSFADSADSAVLPHLEGLRTPGRIWHARVVPER